MVYTKPFIRMFGVCQKSNISRGLNIFQQCVNLWPVAFRSKRIWCTFRERLVKATVWMCRDWNEGALLTLALLMGCDLSLPDSWRSSGLSLPEKQTKLWMSRRPDRTAVLWDKTQQVNRRKKVNHRNSYHHTSLMNFCCCWIN